MVRYALAVVLCVLVSVGHTANTQSEPVGVINAQIAAFQADDLDTAFSFASPMIKRLFGSAERFGQMVKRSYPMVWRPTAVRFGSLSTVDGQPIQTVYFTDQNGSVFEARYHMIDSDNGWQINGVYVRRAGVGA